jgi:hypothetical protein
LEIERTDFHISSAPTTAANLTQFKTRKEPFPVRLTFREIFESWVARLGAMTKVSPVVAWIVDDTGLPKKGTHSVGVAEFKRPQCGLL